MPRFDARHQAANAARTEALAFAQPSSRESGSVSCIAPCHNEARNLEQLLPQLRDTLQACTHPWEVILVDDGSSDATSLVLAKWAQTPGFRALLLSRNFGKEAALTAGLEAAQGDAIVMMDADLQHSPSFLPAFLEYWCQGRDVVYALREDRQNERRFKRLGTRLFYKLVNMAGRFEVPAGAGDFRLMDRAVVNALMSLPERNRFMKGLYAWVGFDALAVPYVPEGRVHGKTTFNPWNLIPLSVDGLAAALAGTFLGWYRVEKSLSIHEIVTRRRELFYWAAILCTFALGTTAGDLASETLGLGYAWGAVAYGALIAITFAAWRMGGNAILTFWIGYIVTRPFGARLGDLLTRTKAAGGLGMGTAWTSATFLSVIVLLMGFAQWTTPSAVTEPH